MWPFKFKKTGSGSLGTGVSDLAFLKPQTNAQMTLTGAGRVVRGVLDPLQRTPQVMALQATTDVSLRGNGVYLAGQMVMQSLTDFEKKNREGRAQ